MSKFLIIDLDDVGKVDKYELMSLLNLSVTKFSIWFNIRVISKKKIRDVKFMVWWFGIILELYYKWVIDLRNNSNLLVDNWV